MENDHGPYLKDYSALKKGLIIGGSVAAGLGLLLTIVGFLDFFIGFQDMTMPTMPYLLFIGIPMFVAGVGCLTFGLRGSISRFVASQEAPVAKDVTNYMLDGTRGEAERTAEAISQGLAARKGEESVICPKCGSKNKKEDKFCDRCGAPLRKPCPKCGALNDSDAEFCSQCGQKLD
jgi:ribosomal protein L40E